MTSHLAYIYCLFAALKEASFAEDLPTALSCRLKKCLFPPSCVLGCSEQAGGLNNSFTLSGTEDPILITSVGCELYSRSPVDSILEAVLTASPNRQYLGIANPTTPATTEPVWIPVGEAYQ